MLKKNNILTVNVTDINHMGLGVAKHEGAVIFIQNGVSGDTLQIKIIKQASSYYVARTEKIISPSPYRVLPLCPHYKKCGGCIYQNITEEYENTLKENRVKNEFARFGVSCNSFEGIVSTGFSAYRNKLQCPVGSDGKVGFYAQKSHDIIDVDMCMLEEKLLKPVYEFLKKELSSDPKPEIRHLYLRCGAGSGEVMVCFVCRRDSFKGMDELVKKLTEKFPQIKSVILNVNDKETNVVLGKKCITLFGSDFIEDVLLGLRFRISPLSFYQVNHDCTELLYRTAIEYADIKPTETVADLFCGIGTIGLCLNSITPAKSLIGVDVVPSAIENAIFNAKANGVENASFYCSPAENFDFGAPDVLIVDPPRKGLDAKLIEMIGKGSPDRIVYISCSPDTLARDCAMLQKHGYTVKRAKAVNMFPRTGHVESVVCLSRK